MDVDANTVLLALVIVQLQRLIPVARPAAEAVVR